MKAAAGSVGTAIGIQLPLIASGIIVARTLGVESRGQFALFDIIVAVLTLIGGLGLPVGLTYFLARGASLHKIVASVRAALVAQLVVLTPAHAAILYFVFRNAEPTVRSAAWLTLALLPCSLAQSYCLAILQGRRRFLALNSVRVLPPMLYSFAVVCIFVVGLRSLTAVTLAWCSASLAATGLIAGVALGGRRSLDSATEVRGRDVLRFGLKGALGSTSPIEAFKLDQTAAGLLLSSSALGIYAVGTALTTFPRLIGSSLGSIAYPVVASCESPRNMRRTVLRFTVVGCSITAGAVIGLEALSGWLIPTAFGEPFRPAVGVTHVLLIGAFFAGMRKVLADCAQGMGRPGVSSVAEVFSWTALVASLVLLTPRYGVEGVASSVVVAYAVSFTWISLRLARSMRLDPLSSDIRHPTGGVSRLFRFTTASSLPHLSPRDRRAFRPSLPRGYSRLLCLLPHTPRRLLAGTLLSSLSVGLAAALTYDWASSRYAIWAAAVGGLTVVQFLTLRRRLAMFPAVVLACAIFNLVAAAGALLYRRISEQAAVSAVLPDSQSVYHRALLIFAVASLGIWAGGALASAILSPHSTPSTERSPQLRAQLRGRWLLALASLLPMGVEIVGYGVSALLARPFYLHYDGPPTLVKLGSVLFPIGVSAAALFTFRATSALQRLVGSALVGMYGLLAFSMGSRVLAVIPVVVLLSHALTKTDSPRHLRGHALFACTLSLILLHVTLTLRTPEEAGFLPYIRAFNRHTLWPLASVADLGNVLFSVPLTGYTVSYLNHLPHRYFFTSINPLPGSFTNWAQIQPLLKLNAYTPTNALGELALYGYGVLLIYAVAVGFVITRLQMTVSRWSSERASVGQAIIGAATILFVVCCLQYNLRTATRVLWYLFLVIVFATVVIRSQRGLKGSGFGNWIKCASHAQGRVM